MAFIKVAGVAEMPAGTMKGISVRSNQILLANIAGKFYAIGGICTHAGGDLSQGRLEGKIVTCPRHGSRFDVTTGMNVGGPAEKNEPAYEVKVEGKNIFVNI